MDARIQNFDGVYEPREDSQLLAELVGERAFGEVLDLGTGSGIQGITAALRGCRVTFSDISERAIEAAKRNAELNEVDGQFIVSDMFAGIGGDFDTIIFNPPYLPDEGGADAALDGGPDGRAVIDRFIGEYRRHLREGGIALLLESSLDRYGQDIERQGAELVGKRHYFFEDLAVLMLR